MEINEIKDANGKIAGYTLSHLKYYLAPIDKTQTINLDPKSQIFLIVDGKDTEIAIADVFDEITSMQGNIIKGWSMLQLIEEDYSVKVNDKAVKVGVYDKITGVHCNIVEIDVELIRKKDKEVTAEDLAKYWNILQVGKVTAKNEVTNAGPTVEELLAKALKEKEELEKKIEDEKKAAEQKIIDEQKAKEEKEAKELKEKQEKEEIEAKLQKAKEEQAEKEKKEAEEKAALAEQKRKDTIAKTLGGQDYLDFQAKRKSEGYHEYSSKAFRFFFKSEDDAVFFIKLVIGGYVNLEDALDTYTEGENEEYIYDFNDEDEKKDLIFDPKKGTIEIKKSKAKAENA